MHTCWDDKNHPAGIFAFLLDNIKTDCYNKQVKFIGVSYNGSIGVSKTFDGSSILSTPASKTKNHSFKNDFFVLLRGERIELWEGIWR